MDSAMIELAIHPHSAVRRAGLVLFAPVFTLVTVAVLLGLLAIFLLWLAAVGILFGGIVATDLAQRWAAWFARPPIALRHRPAA
jgi:positive regulator of sigma E activity